MDVAPVLASLGPVVVVRRFGLQVGWLRVSLAGRAPDEPAPSRLVEPPPGRRKCSCSSSSVSSSDDSVRSMIAGGCADAVDRAVCETPRELPFMLAYPLPTEVAGVSLSSSSSSESDRISIARRLPGVTFGLVDRVRFWFVEATGGAAPCSASHSVEPYWLF